MDECIQQIQPLLITGNKRQFYFGWKPADRTGIVKTSTALRLLSLEDSSNPSVILPHTCSISAHIGRKQIIRRTISLEYNARWKKHQAKAGIKQQYDIAALIFSGDWSLFTHTRTHRERCLRPHITDLGFPQFRVSRQMPRVSASQLANGANWRPVASGKVNRRITRSLFCSSLFLHLPGWNAACEALLSEIHFQNTNHMQNCWF